VQWTTRIGRSAWLIPRMAALLAVAAVAGLDRASAAGSAYQVDTGVISSPGACKVDSWMSSAASKDFFAAMAPTCVADLYRPVELSAQFSRFRSGEEWTTAVAPKVKTNIVPGGGVGEWSVAVAVTAAYDFTARQFAGINFTAPATLRLSENVRVNINAGYLRGMNPGRDFFSYGAGIDLRTPDNVWTVTGEVFGVAAPAREDDKRGDLQPRGQLGLRWRPVDDFNVDLIYGRNLLGESANWITLATTIRFKVAK
jgi:hypothetical protein